MKCNCQTFCRSNCPNVQAENECNENNCRLTHDCLNRPTRSTVRPPVEVLRTSNKNFGLFASSTIQSGMFVVEYVEVIHLDLPETDKSYVLEGTIRSQHWWIDARQKGNLSRFANHSGEPNTTVASLNDYSDVSNPRKFFLRANSRIEKGDEITFRYSDNRIEFPCLCMTQSCVNGKRTQLEAVAVIDTDTPYVAWARQALARYSCEGHAIHSRIYKSELHDPIQSYVTSPRCVVVLASPVA